jgi:two-component system, OmpR family, sensor histidine kinase KdpD
VLRRRPVRVLVALSGVVLVTYVAYRVIPVNATTVGFAYLLLILMVASTWGFLEAALASVPATLVFNFFFLPPVGTFTIADPQNWVALSSFLATSLIASRLSARAKTRASEAVERQRDLERLYTFSRAMLLIDRSAPFAKQRIEKLPEIFDLQAALNSLLELPKIICVSSKVGGEVAGYTAQGTAAEERRFQGRDPCAS